MISLVKSLLEQQAATIGREARALAGRAGSKAGHYRPGRADPDRDQPRKSRAQPARQSAPYRDAQEARPGTIGPVEATLIGIAHERVGHYRPDKARPSGTRRKQGRARSAR